MALRVVRGSSSCHSFTESGWLFKGPPVLEVEGDWMTCLSPARSRIVPCGVLWAILSWLFVLPDADEVQEGYLDLFPLIMLMCAWLILYLFIPFEYVSVRDPPAWSQFSSCSVLVNLPLGPFWSTFWVQSLAGQAFLALFYIPWDVTLSVAAWELGKAGPAPRCYNRRIWCWVLLTLAGAETLTNVLISANRRSLLPLLLTKRTLHLFFYCVFPDIMFSTSL